MKKTAGETFTYTPTRGPALAVDCVVFGLDDDDPAGAAHQRARPPAGRWALPGGFVQDGRDLRGGRRELRGGDRARSRLARAALHLQRRGPRSARRVVSVARCALVKQSEHAAHAASDAAEAVWHWHLLGAAAAVVRPQEDRAGGARERLRGR